MARILISCRREDWCAEIAVFVDHLKLQLETGCVLVSNDVAQLSSTVEAIEFVEGCDLLVPIIGPSWTTANHESQLDPNPAHARMTAELEKAIKLQRGIYCLMNCNLEVPFVEPLPSSLLQLANVPQVKIDPLSLSDKCVENTLADSIIREAISPYGSKRYACSHDQQPYLDRIAHWLVRTNSWADKSIPLPAQEAILIGRHPDCDIQIDMLSISRRHAKLRYTPAGYVLQDLWSRGGIYINGIICDKQTDYSLNDRDKVSFSNLEYLYRVKHLY